MSKLIPFLLVAVLVFVGCEKEEKQTAKPKKKNEGHLSTKSMNLASDTPECNWKKGEKSTDDAPQEGEYFVRFVTTNGNFTMKVNREWAPRGAERFYQLVNSNYFDGAPFFRVVSGFVVQFGLCADPDGSQYWDENFPDEEVKESNTTGMVTFAKGSEKNTRSTQIFINYSNNTNLDSMGFSPFAKVVSGMSTVNSLYSGYGERPTNMQSSIKKQGVEFCKENFPEFDYIVTARVVDGIDEADIAAEKAKIAAAKAAAERGEDVDPGNGVIQTGDGDITSHARLMRQKDDESDDEDEEVVTTDPDAKFSPVTFESSDGLEVSGDLYVANKDKSTPFIVLCHQAGWSRGEYREIAPKLGKLGFNCLAIDQRSGGEVNEVKNLTLKRARDASKETGFVDAEQDIIAALNWAKSHHADGKLILWGSSYSAALSLRIAGEHPDLIDAALAFAPSEYFKRFDKPKDWITQSATKISVPVFVTSAKDEKKNWQAIFDAIPGDSKTSFLPETKGQHGSRALWDKFSDSDSYWKSVTTFLQTLK